MRREAAALLGLPEARVRCVAPDVGGGFGGKGHVYPEDLLITFLARRLGRPVRWIEGRSEHLMSATHSRDQLHDLEVGFDDDGRILAIRDDYIVDCGAWNPIGSGVAYNTAVHLTGPYKIENLAASGTIVVTNKVPNAPYRGAGPPGSRLCDGAHDRPGGAQPRPGAGRGAPAQHDPRRGDAVPGRHPLSRRRADRLRQRRLPGGAGEGARGARRPRRVPPAPGRGAARGPLSRPRHRLLHRGHRGRAVRERLCPHRTLPARSTSRAAPRRRARAWRRSFPRSWPICGRWRPRMSS